MKIGLISDIHLEFGDLDLPMQDPIDVLILGGDICVAANIELFVPFFERISKVFPEVIYIMGNHEHYNGCFDRSEEKLRESLAHLKNIHILEKETKQIGDVYFIGQTLWTDFNKRDPLTTYNAGLSMNDYRIIHLADQQNRRLTPDDILHENERSIQYLNLALSSLKDQKVVVVGHHAPSPQSVKPRYERDYHMNGCYNSDLTGFILDNPQIKVWTHGHTHSPFDYMVGDTRVVCNPRGYWKYETVDTSYTYKVIEV